MWGEDKGDESRTDNVECRLRKTPDVEVTEPRTRVKEHAEHGAIIMRRLTTGE